MKLSAFIDAVRPHAPTFQPDLLRVLVGLVALSLPSLVVLLAQEPLSSISASYYADEARDEFVGLLFFVAAFLFGYNGKLLPLFEAPIAKFAAICAICVALFPTAPDFGEATTASIHAWSAVLLFVCLLIFCLSFAYGAYLEGSTRFVWYLVCAVAMSAGLALGAYGLTQSEAERVANRTLFWAEWVALVSFAGAWLVAGAHKSVIQILNRKGWINNPHIERVRTPFWEKQN